MSNLKQIPPRMQNLPRIVDSYARVVGNNNPFTDAGVSAYGYTAEQLNNFMLVLHGMTPVMNDYAKLHMQIVLTCTENTPKYAAMYAARIRAADTDPDTEFDWTETTTHTGTVTDGKTGSETHTKTGSVADSGTDTTTNNNTVTDSTVTYDNGTFRETGKSVSGGGGSLTHGKTTTYNQVSDALTFANRENEREYNDTVTKTVTGYKNSPTKIMQEYTDFVRRNNVFMEIINDVLQAISCKIYIPVVPENEEE